VATRAVNTLGQRKRSAEVTGLGQFGRVNFCANYSYQDARHDDPRSDRRNAQSRQRWA